MAAPFFVGLFGQVVDSPEALAALVPDASRLHLQGIGPEGLHRLRALPALTQLEVSSKVHGATIGDEVFEEIAHLRGLTDLALTNWHGTGKGLARLRELPALRGLYIRFTRIGSEGAAEIGQLTQLRQLYLDASLPGSAFRFLPALQSLTDLDLVHCDLDVDFFPFIAQLPRLTSLNVWVEAAAIGERQVAAITACTKLRSLDLGRCQQQLGSAVAALCRLKGLEHLGLLGCDLSEGELFHLSKLRKLQSLDAPLSQAAGQGVSHLARLPRLRRLDLAFKEGITDDSIRAFAGHRQLEQVDLSGCKELTAAAIAPLAALPSLRSLRLSGCELGDDALLHLSRARSLRLLNLGHCERPSDVGIRALSGLSELEVLGLSGNKGVTSAGMSALSGLHKLRTLDLGFTRVGDAGIGALTELPELANLSLLGCPITDAVVPHLMRLRTLQAMDLGCTDLTDAALRQLAALPRLALLYLEGCDELTRTTVAEVRARGIEIDQRHSADWV